MKLILSLVLCVAANPVPVCWKASNARGAGTVPKTCETGNEKCGAGRCCQSCTNENSCCTTGKGGTTHSGDFKPNMTSSCHSDGALVCWTGCEPGYKDYGATCTNWTHTYDKFTCTRTGTDKPANCTEGQQKDSGLCYPQCKADQNPIGPVCWGTCGGDNPVDGGAVCCSDPSTCSAALKQLIFAFPLAVLKCIAEATTNPIQCARDILSAAGDFTLPTCSSQEPTTVAPVDPTTQAPTVVPADPTTREPTMEAKGSGPTNCGEQNVDCTAHGDSGSECVFGHHCKCSDDFRCEGGAEVGWQECLDIHTNLAMGTCVPVVSVAV